MKKIQKGFTLIELLVVIGIIAVLASISLVSLTSANEKAKRSSALASMASAMPELVVCGDDGGTATIATPTSSLYVCATDNTGVNAFGAHSAKWPNISGGWSYGIPTGSIGNVPPDYTYIGTKSGQTTITCTFVNSKCI